MRDDDIGGERTLHVQLGRDARIRWARLMHQVNVNMRGLGQLDPIAVFCECGYVDCHAVLWLSAAQFDACTVIATRRHGRSDLRWPDQARVARSGRTRTG